MLVEVVSGDNERIGSNKENVRGPPSPFPFPENGGAPGRSLYLNQKILVFIKLGT